MVTLEHVDNESNINLSNRIEDLILMVSKILNIKLILILML